MMYISALTEAEFKDIVEKMRPHVERTMKLEVAPWLKNTDVGMDSYCELPIEKYHPNYFLTKVKYALKSYKEWFDSGIVVCRPKGTQAWAKPHCPRRWLGTGQGIALIDLIWCWWFF